MSNLPRLAELLRARNTLEGNIANLVQSSVNMGTIGEYIAASIFAITLTSEARYTECAGSFANPPFAGRTVDIQWYLRREGFMTVHGEVGPDFYLVLTGPKPESSRIRALVTPWLISAVYLFEAQSLLLALRERGVQIGSHTSVINQLWERAEIFPNQNNPQLVLTDEQRQLLQLFQ